MKRWRTDDLPRRAFVAALALLFGAMALAWPESAEARSVPLMARSFSPEGLARVGAYFHNEVATGKIPGAVVLIQQHGKPVFSEIFGVRDVTTKVPMTEDTIFRLYSMSKPVTSVAAMMLVDDGRLALDQPLAKYIPAFADVMVAAERHGEGRPSLATEPLKRPITIEDLLRHTSGITYGFYGDSSVRKLYANSDCSRAISTTPHSSSVWQSCRSPNSRASCGITAIRPTCSAAWSRWCRDNPCSRSRRRGCSIP
jgi:CubicO group peptidase (beta-lactamase class C family)